MLADPSSENPVSLEPVVNYVLEADAVADDAPRFAQGSRATVRFVHDPAPVGPRLWRAMQRTFLRFIGA